MNPNQAIRNRLWKDSMTVQRDSATGDAVPSWSTIANGVACNVFETPNFDKVTGVGRLKEDNIFTSNYIHCDPSADIRDGDRLVITYRDASTATMVVKGMPQRRRLLSYMQVFANLQVP